MQLVNNIINSGVRYYNEYTPLTSSEVIDDFGNKAVNFCSTQYLGIPWRADFNEQINSIKIDGSFFGSLGSNYLGGTHPSRLKLENKIKKLMSYPKALCFASGWAANYSICEYLSKDYDLIVSDIKNHNSVITGLKANHVKKLIVDLNETDLSEIVKDYKEDRIAVIYPTVEGITGVETFLKFSNLDDRRKVTIITDECHSFGILGHLGIKQHGFIRPDIRMIGFSKSLGIMGAAVLSSEVLINDLTQIASPWIYSTAIPPIIWDVISISLDISLECKKERIQIIDKANLLRSELNRFGISHSGSLHITGINFPSSIDPRHIENDLKSLGFFVIISEPPTTKNDELISRIAIQPTHTYQDIRKLVKCIFELLYI
ncbi:pyridoxal phosphate-dependent aminotransferase family protein [Lentimicrobium sp. L6]|uniref:aminotransferase class I/II-fold pyridoxal phosphate-dependent enzyme n=1 Tax=Lentimicrobium sp. L6 TaxID=2735916 RepID=UPI00155224CB|nr:pyridoxal phosphate-dependent aminotransferase family protein [Lentimicrobium sp. L6]NPD85146.1 pyridoxal phosphate-dependent aminotransferase family protein [Lentimicrobium sp. L6]